MSSLVVISVPDRAEHHGAGLLCLLVEVVAGVRLLSSVCSNVHLQVSSLIESLSASHPIASWSLLQLIASKYLFYLFGVATWSAA